MSIIKIGLCGINGRMGQAICESIRNKGDKFILAASLSSAHEKGDLVEFCNHSDIIIDFSNAHVLEELTKAAMLSKTNLVVGTTGLKNKHFTYLKELSKHVAVLYAANTSIGANLIAMLAAKSAKILQEYDVEIIEAHHRYKQDAPSGTALMIGEKIADAIGVDFTTKAVFDRANKGPRQAGEIGFSSIRGGGIFGENEVLFAGDNEVVTIGSRALSRVAFADGALFAAQWLSNKKAGLYSMQDVLQL
ncbi:MAG: 4-hydroxy-tetrahydrodipicolinate reductase [Rickettsiaceae bacterium]|nr:4-hydroxy-tetrahydrodipicolinate reductase [Rickettsiaceae bacterium]MDP4832087.1 4-hydroxy-tetrahydrodipicolinate reductase [Rickettsiaceae bacterium]MDP5020288.1 4-hydroxy-tetrahydrodipicolinate reductase [Rickettsiaceae bacterium]MDP5083709.1 4-hydroxy-tetrahydrodipicolinate reductase [Rickettsiaceae bacterium]